MTVLFLYFPKDIDMYVQRSGKQLGPPIEIATYLKPVWALRELLSAQEVGVTVEIPVLYLFAVTLRSPIHGLIPYCIRD